MDACRGHSLIGSHHFFFSGKNEFPKFSSGGIFWVFSTQMEMLIFEFGKLQFPTNKKKTGIFFPNFRYLYNSTVGKLGFSEARAYRPVTASIIRFARLELDDGSTEKCIESISTR